MTDPDLPDYIPAFSPTLDVRGCADRLLRGQTTEDIARDTHTPLATVEAIAADPKTTFLLQKRPSSRYTGGKFDVERALADETEKTFNVITSLRDSAEKDEVRLRAAVELFDRQRPKVTKNETEMTVRITLSQEQQSLATNLEAEIATLDAEFASYEPPSEQGKLE